MNQTRGTLRSHLTLELLHVYQYLLDLSKDILYIYVCQRDTKLQTIKVFNFNPDLQVCRPLANTDLQYLSVKFWCIVLAMQKLKGVLGGLGSFTAPWITQPYKNRKIYLIQQELRLYKRKICLFQIIFFWGAAKRKKAGAKVMSAINLLVLKLEQRFCHFSAECTGLTR